MTDRNNSYTARALNYSAHPRLTNERLSTFWFRAKAGHWGNAARISGFLRLHRQVRPQQWPTKKNPRL